MRMDPKTRMKRFSRIFTRKTGGSEMESRDKVGALHRVSSMQLSIFGSTKCSKVRDISVGEKRQQKRQPDMPELIALHSVTFPGLVGFEN